MHFKILDQAPADYEQVKTDEKEQLRRERVRLWYVAITRACDLLLLPRQSERKPNDWMSVVDLRLDDLPTFDPRAIVYAPVLPAVEEPENTQDETTWRGEAATIAATRRAIVWRSPSRHEGSPDAAPPPERDEIFSDAAAISEQLPSDFGHCRCRKRGPRQPRARPRRAQAARGSADRARGEQLGATAKALYDRCSDAYQSFNANIAAAALARFVGEFDSLRALYADYKRQAALLDFDDLLHHARDLLVRDPGVRQALARRYPRVLVDEFQDTDPVQAEILLLLSADADTVDRWTDVRPRPGKLFIVGDPKQAIYRFRGADVGTYLEAKHALLAQDADSIIEITANFRSRAPILDFANDRFQPLLSEAAGQPGFTPLAAVRAASPDGQAVACFEVPIDDSLKDSKGRFYGELVREHEAIIVAEIVQRLIGNYHIWDKRTQAMRVCRAGDIALLAPTGASLWR